jgi:uncharacterized RmlC-like cupin family protein
MAVQKSDLIPIEGRVARFDALAPIAAQTDAEIPQSALDLIYARRLLPVIGREGTDTAIAAGAPVRGAGGITITYALCPPGQGPGLHAHRATFETFTVLKGEFEIRWGDEGEQQVTLGLYDVISVPPGYSRAFRNISDEEGMLQVVISGGVHDAHDVVIPPVIARALQQESPRLHEKMAASGITFLEVGAE